MRVHLLHLLSLAAAAFAAECLRLCLLLLCVLLLHPRRSSRSGKKVVCESFGHSIRESFVSVTMCVCVRVCMCTWVFVS